MKVNWQAIKIQKYIIHLGITIKSINGGIL
jgi:hypothetical protein